MDNILHPIIVAFGWFWVQIHNVLTLIGFKSGPGIAWAIAIVIMTVIVRFAILPLYLKQIRSMRNMSVVQPELKKIQDKYKGKKDQVSQQRMQEETMALYKQAGSSPFSSCLPMVAQLPIMFALYRVIYAVAQIANGTYGGGKWDSLGPLDQKTALDITHSKVFGVGLSETMKSVPEMNQKIIFGVLIVIMVLLQFFTMRLSMTKNMAKAEDPNNPMVRSQKSMMYLMPLMYIFSGFVFQMGMLMYMLTTAVFGLAQQYWVVRTMPTPNSPAYEELLERREEKYKAWAVPMFQNYDHEVAALKGHPEELEKLNETTLATVEKDGKKQKISTNFPEDWDAASKVALYRGLAMEPWKAVPDEVWMKQQILAKNSQMAAEAARAARPKKLSREQRMRQAERERLDQEAAARREQKSARKYADRAAKGGNLTPEEVERRRQQRRAERRNQGKNQKKK